MDNRTRREVTREIAREIGAELGRPLTPWRWQWAGRYVWWMQAAAVAALLGGMWGVWSLAGGELGDPFGRPAPLWAAGVVFVTAAAIALLAEAEARATERVAERRRVLVRHGIDPDAPMPAPAFPDGYVLAYELGNQPGQLGTDRAPAFVEVAAVRADRWDLVDALWRVTVVGTPGGRLEVHWFPGSLRGVWALGWLFAGIESQELVDLVGVERALIVRGARDVTSVYHQPPAAG
jgi:hypothetical protein